MIKYLVIYSQPKGKKKQLLFIFDYFNEGRLDCSHLSIRSDETLLIASQVSALCSSGHNAAEYMVHATLCSPILPQPSQLHIELCNYSVALPYPPIESNCVDARTTCC